jgi:hypothetical protein
MKQKAGTTHRWRDILNMIVISMYYYLSGGGLMSADGNRNIQLQVTNNTSETFTVYSANIFATNCQWISDEQAKIGQPLAVNASVTWGAYTTDSNGSADAQVKLKGSKGSLMGFELKNLSNNIALVSVELSSSINYSLQSPSTGIQAFCKAVIIPSN